MDPCLQRCCCPVIAGIDLKGPIAAMLSNDMSNCGLAKTCSVTIIGCTLFCLTEDIVMRPDSHFMLCVGVASACNAGLAGSANVGTSSMRMQTQVVVTGTAPGGPLSSNSRCSGPSCACAAMGAPLVAGFLCTQASHDFTHLITSLLTCSSLSNSKKD